MTTAMKSVIHLPPAYPVRIIFHPSRRRFFRSAPRNRTPVKRSGEMSQRFDIWALLKPNSFDYLADAITLRRSFARTPIGAREDRSVTFCTASVPRTFRDLNLVGLANPLAQVASLEQCGIRPDAHQVRRRPESRGDARRRHSAQRRKPQADVGDSAKFKKPIRR